MEERLGCPDSCSTGRKDARFIVERRACGRSWEASGSPCAVIVVEGEERHDIGGRTLVAAPGQILLVQSGEPHRIEVRSRAGSRRVRLCAGEELLDLATAASSLGRAFLLSASSASERQLIKLASAVAMGADASADAGHAADLYRAILEDTLVRLARVDVRKSFTRSAILQRLEYARGVLHRTLDRPVPLEELARESGMSLFHLGRLFQSVFGEPPARYHRALRLVAAVEALRTEEEAVGEVAWRFGYAELSAFTHAVRRHFGAPPSALRMASAQVQELAA